MELLLYQFHLLPIHLKFAHALCPNKTLSRGYINKNSPFKQFIFVKFIPLPVSKNNCNSFIVYLYNSTRFTHYMIIFNYFSDIITRSHYSGTTIWFIERTLRVSSDSYKFPELLFCLSSLHFL